MPSIDWTRTKAYARRAAAGLPAMLAALGVAMAASSTPRPEIDRTAEAVARVTHGDLSDKGLAALAARLDPSQLAQAMRADPNRRDPALYGLTPGWESLTLAGKPSLDFGPTGLDAQRLNAAMPSMSGALRPAMPFVFKAASEADRRRALRCLTQGIYYEAALESTEGQEGVAQVILNRVRDPNYPNTICGVVFQGAERTTGCQFSFTCDGALAHAPVGWAWERARIVAERALAGHVAVRVGTATHYHADYVHPWWSPTLAKITQIGAHIFYRWKGAPGETASFAQRYATHEPVIDEARFSRPRLLLASADARGGRGHQCADQGLRIARACAAHRGSGGRGHGRRGSRQAGELTCPCSRWLANMDIESQPCGTKARSPGYVRVSAVKLEHPAPIWTEADRVSALHDYGILDTPREEAFDKVVRLIARVFDAPIAVVNLIDTDRQWFKAETGLGVRETPLETSFCAHALLQQDGMVVPDATEDPRFQCNPLVTGDMGLRFYAGRLLRTPEGLPLGTLCVLDDKPRPEGITDLQAQTLDVMADLVMEQITLRRTERDRALSEVALDVSEARFAAIADSMPQMVWSTRPDGFHDYYNARWYEFTGVPAGSTDGEGWNDMVHPEDQERAWALWRLCLATGDPYEIEYRLRRYDGVYRWTLGRAMPIRNADGGIARWFGTCTDIDDLKRMEQGKELLSQELSHRIKNIFAVVSALIALSAREYPEAKAFAVAVRDRIAALARAHEFVRPHTEVSRPTVGAMTLHAFLEALFQPYAADDGSARVRLSGDDARFDDQAATSVALLFHELATNAAKYGALSLPGGYVDLETRLIDDRFVLTWSERGGPAVAGKPERSGFGSSLATVSVEGQLGGRLERNWAPEGLIVVADLPSTALSRRKAAEMISQMKTA